MIAVCSAAGRQVAVDAVGGDVELAVLEPLDRDVVVVERGVLDPGVGLRSSRGACRARPRRRRGRRPRRHTSPGVLVARSTCAWATISDGGWCSWSSIGVSTPHSWLSFGRSEHSAGWSPCARAGAHTPYAHRNSKLKPRFGCVCANKPSNLDSRRRRCSIIVCLSCDWDRTVLAQDRRIACGPHTIGNCPEHSDPGPINLRRDMAANARNARHQPLACLSIEAAHSRIPAPPRVPAPM